MDLLLFVVLLAFTAIQFNDPDPLFWICLYGLSALGPLLTRFRPLIRPVSWLAMGYCLAGFIQSVGGGLEYLPHASQEALLQAMNPDKPYIEEARETLGSALALIMVAGHYLLHKRAR